MLIFVPGDFVRQYRAAFPVEGLNGEQEANLRALLNLIRADHSLLAGSRDVALTQVAYLLATVRHETSGTFGLQPDAYAALSRGLLTGALTGSAIGQYMNRAQTDYVEARRAASLDLSKAEDIADAAERIAHVLAQSLDLTTL